jgi:hypothetical protein
MLKKVLQFCFLRTCSFYICKTCQGPEVDGLLGRATREVILEQVRIGIENIDRKRLMAAPDCGPGMLSRRQAKSKLKNMVAAASIKPVHNELARGNPRGIWELLCFQEILEVRNDR